MPKRTVAYSKHFHPEVQARIDQRRSDVESMAEKMNPREALVSTQWLHNKMKEQDFKEHYKVIDATWDLPTSGRNFTEEHKNKRIPGARYFRYSKIKEKQQCRISLLSMVDFTTTRFRILECTLFVQRGGTGSFAMIGSCIYAFL